MAQEVYLGIRVHRSGQTPHFIVWQVLWGLCPCIGRKRQIHGRNSCLPILSSAAIYSWNACRIRATCPSRHCRKGRQAEEQFHL